MKAEGSGLDLGSLTFWAEFEVIDSRPSEVGAGKRARGLDTWVVLLREEGGEKSGGGGKSIGGRVTLGASLLPDVISSLGVLFTCTPASRSRSSQVFLVPLSVLNTAVPVITCATAALGVEVAEASPNRGLLAEVVRFDSDTLFHGASAVAVVARLVDSPGANTLGEDWSE